MLITLFVIWALLATVVLALAIYRKFALRNVDDLIHVDDSRMVDRQSSVTKTLDVVDKWGKLLTAIVVIYGIGLLGAFMYQSWNESQHIVLK